MTGYRGTDYYLRRHYGSGYYALGLDTYQGQVNMLAQGQLVAHSLLLSRRCWPRLSTRPSSYP
jgi:hypothetical protein